MANFGSALYGVSKYGITPKLAYSVEPMYLLVTDFTEAYISWQIPSGTYSRVRLVRNQNSFPETSEDGVIVYDSYTSSLTKVIFNDGGGIEDTAGVTITSGKPIYYKMFLFDSTKTWVNAGSISGIVPSDHQTAEKLIDLLPKVFTSKEQSPLAEVDTTSVLSSMLDAYGFSLEEDITYLDLLLPDHTLISTPSSLIPLEVANYGLVNESGLPVKNQKHLIREAIYMYTHKGTLNGINTYVEALTSYAPTTTVSQNLLLTPQDSTFYKSTGNWISTNTSGFASSTEQTPPTNSNNIDLSYTCKIVATSAGSMTLGEDSPILKGVPLTPGTTYVLSAQVKSPSSAGTITPSLSYYDGKGTIVGSATVGSATSATNTWAQTSVTKKATKQIAVGVSSATGASGTITYITNVDHELVTGDVVSITGFSGADTGFNLTGVAITGTPSTTTFTVSNALTGTTTTTGYAKNAVVDAVYASLKFSWSAAGTYYIDMVCLQSGTSVSYDEARAVNIFLNPDKTNYIKNPSFESNVTTGWTATGSPTITQDTNVPSSSYSGTKSAKIVATGSWTYTSNTVPVTTGTYYTGSAYVQSSTGLTLTLVVRDSGGTIIGSYTGAVPSVTSASFVRQYVSKLIGANTSASTVEVKFSGGAGTFYIDSVQFEQSPKPTDYIDGNLNVISGNPFGAVWQGTTDNSYSSVYNSKPLKVPRLGYTLVNWLPQNCWWRIQTYAGIEYTNLTAV